MKVALINPPFDMIKEGYGGRGSTKYGHWPPLGLAYISAYLVEKGHSVKIIDAPPLNLTPQQILEELEEWKPDLAGITSLLTNFQSALKLADFIRSSFDVPIVAGGPYPSEFSDDVFEESSSIDIVVRGEGEVVMAELVARMESGQALDGLEGVWFRRNGHVVKNPVRKPKGELDDLPFPARHLFDRKLYRPFPFQVYRTPVAGVVSSRGCSYGKCSFCTISRKFGYYYRRRTPENVMEEIEHLARDEGYREVYFWDDNFIVSGDWIIRFCDLLKKAKLDLTWLCLARVDKVTPEILKVMAEAGCVRINFGIESGNQDLIDVLKKNITLEQARNAVKWAHEVGIEVKGDFILAIPGETPQQGLETIRFAKELDLDLAEFSAFQFFQNTDLYDKACGVESGSPSPEKFVYQGRYLSGYVPDDYDSAQQVNDMVNKAFKSFYLRPKYFWKTLKKLKTFNDFKRYWAGLLFFLKVS